ncbi:MAG: 1-deoxy-D-xylulose-5-phosphate synthase, partial [Opitutaceae bacterium]|nr:1-deoxy-D-xylulose-5-phosphate synthase [Opitutaceae bacterium]
IMQPKDEDELVDMLHTGLQLGSPCFIRYPRGAGEGVAIKESPVALPIGKAETVREGNNIIIWALGPMVPLAQKLAAEIEADQGITVGVVNARFAKPLDIELLEKHANKASLLVTMEDHVVTGGFGSAVLEALQGFDRPAPLERIGWPDRFVEHGSSVDVLRAAHGLSPDKIKQDILCRWQRLGAIPVEADA